MIAMPMVGDFQILYKGKTEAPAYAIIEQHHLDSFIQPAEDFYGEEDAGFELGLGLE
jgi:hypothetical protein